MGSCLVSDRLYRLSGVIKEKREKLKRENEEIKDKEYTFHPQIHENSKVLMRKYDNQAPIYERYKEVMHERELYKHNMLVYKENEDRKKNNFFKPRINERSKEIIERRRRMDMSADNISKENTYSKENAYSTHNPYTNANERLYNKGLIKLKHKQKMEILHENEKNQSKDYLFKPLTCNSILDPDERKGNIEEALRDILIPIRNPKQLDEFVVAYTSSRLRGNYTFEVVEPELVNKEDIKIEGFNYLKSSLTLNASSTIPVVCDWKLNNQGVNQTNATLTEEEILDCPAPDANALFIKCGRFRLDGNTNNYNLRIGNLSPSYYSVDAICV
jgi:hypothetical protein